MAAVSTSPSMLSVTSEKPVEVDPENGSAPVVDPEVDLSEYPTGFSLVMIVVAICLSIFLVSLDLTIVATAIPRITDEFHSLDQVGWYGSAFFLTLAGFQSTWGKAYKYWNLKPVFILSVIIFEIGSLICAVANNSTTLIVGRSITGLGGAGIASGAYIIIAFVAIPARRPAFTGILGAVYGIASVVGPLLGGVFTDYVTWRWCFYINLPLGGSALAIIVLLFQTPSTAKPVKASIKEKILQLDLPGTFIIMGGMVCYLLALQWGGVTKAWSDPSVIGTLVGFGVLVIVFILWEWYQNDRALMLPRVLKQRTVLVSCIFIFFLGGAFFLLIYYLPIYFQAIDGISAAQSGIRNIPLILGSAIFSIVSGGAIVAIGYFTPFLTGGAAIATIGAGLIYSLHIGSTSGAFIGYQVVAGIGFGLSFQIPVIAGQAFSDPSDISAATAIVLFFQTIGGAFFVSAGQSVFLNKLVTSLPTLAPGVDPAQVILTGATELRNVFNDADLLGIMSSYMVGLRAAWAISIAVAGVATVVSVFAQHVSIKGKIPM